MKQRFPIRRRKSGKKLVLQLVAGIAVAVCILLLVQYIVTPDYPETEDGATLSGPVAGGVGTGETGPGQTEEAKLPEAEPDASYVFRNVVEEGDNASKILQEWLTLGEIHEVTVSCNEVYSLAKINVGHEYVITSGTDGFERFEYEIDDFERLVVERCEAGFAARIEKLPCDIRLECKRFVIQSNLFQTVADAGEKPVLAILLADIFGWEVNFIKELRENDTFDILIEKRYLNGEFKGYGQLLAAYFVNQGKSYEAFRFADGHGAPHYFTSDGESLKRAFLKAPLSFSRISSGYTMRRLHPIHKVVRPHPGIDYAAPIGTPVKAIGSGTVLFAGWGGGAGRYIKIKHSNGYESTYMHLSGFARGLKKGKSVRQGEVIGYVGSTGWSTGPHLDFRMKHNGKFINPMTVTSPRSEPVHASKKAEFNEKVALYKAFLSGDKPLHEYQVVSK